MRALLRTELEDLDVVVPMPPLTLEGATPLAPPPPPRWRHMTDQIGMFCYSGLTATQVN